MVVDVEQEFSGGAGAVKGGECQGERVGDAHIDVWVGCAEGLYGIETLRREGDDSMGKVVVDGSGRGGEKMTSQDGEESVLKRMCPLDVVFEGDLVVFSAHPHGELERQLIIMWYGS